MPKTKWESVIFTAYKFFDSKELLFFVVPEDIHTEGFAAAQHSLQGNAALPRGGTALAAAVRGLILTVSHQSQMGQLYPQVLSLLVHGACRELF